MTAYGRLCANYRRKPTGALVLFLRGNARRAALKLGNPDTEKFIVRIAQAELHRRGILK